MEDKKLNQENQRKAAFEARDARGYERAQHAHQNRQAHVRTQARQANFWQRYFITENEAGKGLSWGVVIAGVVASIATFLLLSFLTSAVGLGTFSPNTADPLGGVGVGMLVMFVISLVVSLFVGGFVAGLAARYSAGLHGFLTWALAVALSMFLLASGVANLMGAFGNVVSSALGLAGDSATTVAQGVGDAAGAVAGSAADAVNNLLKEAGLDTEFNVDTQMLSQETAELLKDTEVPQLQPDYLKNQFTEVADEVQAGVQSIAKNPDSAETVLKDLKASIENRVTEITAAVDREDITKAVSKNTDLTQDEVEQWVTKAEEEVTKAQAQAQQVLTDVSAALEKVPGQVQQMQQEVAQTTDQATDAASGISVWIFVGLLLAMVVSVVGALAGVKVTQNSDENVLA
ncbi:MAG: hypothetical protein PUJ57_00805 [Peptoniphilaceae bacterium]|nr:hypothetical protein [Peptoniphilaceae bacterium]MDY6086078.1 hypothetical protein [Peptoniphilaceae bacterium]